MLVRVLTDNGGPKPVPLLARVLEERDDGTYSIIYLSKAEEDERGRSVYRYEEDPYEIDDDYIIEYLDNEIEAGFEQYDDEGWIKKRRTEDESDDDYTPSDEGEETDEDEEDDESLVYENDDGEYDDGEYDDDD